MPSAATTMPRSCAKCSTSNRTTSGDSQSIIRGLNPHNALPAVTSYFYTSADDGIWQTWKYLANGNKGLHRLGGTLVRRQNAPAVDRRGRRNQWNEAEKISQIISGAEWIDDGVALYYSHASIQLGWIMDAEAHGKTWINRNGDDALGSSHLVRHAWINMLRDEGIQFGWLSYVDLIQHGVPAKYKVLILPATLCLSDAEAREIKKFCAAGGTVIADYLPGVWDQHGKGRADGGALDEMFGVRHDPKMKAGDIFGTRLWCETDQDANFGYKSYEQLLTSGNTSIKDASGFDKAVRTMGVGACEQIRQGHRRADEPFAAMVQRLPCRRIRRRGEARSVHEADPRRRHPSLGRNRRRGRKAIRL